MSTSAASLALPTLTLRTRQPLCSPQCFSSSLIHYSKPISISAVFLKPTLSSRFVPRVAVSSDLEQEEDTFSDGDGPSFSPDVKLFVGNLPFTVDSAQLAELFESAGNVEVVEVIYDKTTGRSRGFGFVTMSSVEEAEAAAQQFNGYAMLSTRQMDTVTVHEENDTENADQVVLDFRKHLHHWPHLQNLLASSQTGEISASSTLQQVSADSDRHTNGVQCNRVSLAKKTLSTSKQGFSVVEDLKSIKADNDSIPFGLASTSLADPSIGRNKTVRSTRLLERRSKQRKVPKSKVIDDETYLARKDDAQAKLRVEKKKNEELDQNDPLGLFLRGPETKQLLTLEQESQLISQIQDLLRLEELKTKLQSQFGREPTMAEWAEGAGLNCRMLHAQLRSGSRSREKLIQANLRMVVHVAKSYQGRGLSLQDLLQEGSMGLMKSVEKFNPLVGSRFGNYAFWWIRQAIRKAVFRHSRTIRLPEKVFILLGKVMEAKKLYVQEGNLHPTKEELARRVGVTVEKIDKLLFSARIPISMQQTVWADQNTTFQEITADPTVEATDVSVEKQLMRKHVLNVLSILHPKERRIIRLRYGFEDGEQKSLSEIGDIFGLSKERVRQLEIRALYKLKKCLVKQGLDAYVDLLL